MLIGGSGRDALVGHVVLNNISLPTVDASQFVDTVRGEASKDITFGDNENDMLRSTEQTDVSFSMFDDWVDAAF
ncbi:MAG: hypothetical protein CMJ78_03550 [Planctomycetaceae bacterium]|nr:hypothetical protein [Planctomycetaceae bacterium]